MTTPNIFVKQVCEVKSFYSHHTPDCSFGNLIVFNNSFVKINCVTSYCDSLRDAYVYLVNTYSVLMAVLWSIMFLKYHINTPPFTTYFVIISAIPRHWGLRLGGTDSMYCCTSEVTVPKVITTPKASRYV